MLTPLKICNRKAIDLRQHLAEGFSTKDIRGEEVGLKPS